MFLNTIRLLNYAVVAVGFVVCMADSVQRSDLNAENAIKLICGRKEVNRSFVLRVAMYCISQNRVDGNQKVLKTDNNLLYEN